MLEPKLGHYETTALERMLYSYRALATLHLENGHFALAAWSKRMGTFVTIELNRREMAANAALERQLTIGDDEAS